MQKCESLSPQDIARLQAFVDEHTHRGAQKILGLAPETLLRSKAGKPITEKTAARIIEVLIFSAITADEVEIAAEEAALNTRRALAQIMDPEKAKRIGAWVYQNVKSIARP